MLPAPAPLENEGRGEDLALPTRSTDKQMKTCKENKNHPEDEKEGTKEILLRELLREK